MLLYGDTGDLLQMWEEYADVFYGEGASTSTCKVITGTQPPDYAANGQYEIVW